MIGKKTPETFGVWVRTYRKRLDLTQAALGKRAGCSEAAIRKIEADERRPSRQLAELLARALEIPAEEYERFLQFARGIYYVDPQTGANAHTQPGRHNLPSLLTATIDRTRDLANILAILRNTAVHQATLIGPPGIGKTRLSIHCGYEMLEQFPDGVWFVDLSELTQAEFFISSIARSVPALNLPPSPQLSQLISGLKEKRMLLILDNFEQIVEGAAPDVVQILKACPNITILVTSRVPLHIYGEHEYRLPPLSIPPDATPRTQAALMQFEAVQLFIARIRQHQPEFTITPDNAAAIIEICSILEGIPLALELTAATLHQMTLEELSALLCGKDWVRQIGSPARDLPQRQRTLENVIAWSYLLLDDAQKNFFGKLGVFSSWFDTEAAGFICKMATSQVRQLANALSDHSLLMRENIKGKTTWRMLEIIREYAVSKLQPEELEHVEQLRADYYLDRIRSLKQDGLYEVREEYIQTNLGNLHGALKWMIHREKTEQAFELAEQLDDSWTSLGYFKEGLNFLRQLLALPSNADLQLRARRLYKASDLAWHQYDFISALVYAEEAAELGRVYGMKREYPYYLNRLGRICIEQGKLGEAQSYLCEAFELVKDDPAGLNPGAPLAQLGEISLFQGNLAEAKAYCEQALSYLSDEEDIFVAIAKTDLVEIELARNNYAQAYRWLTESIQPASQHVRRAMVYLSALAGYLGLSLESSSTAAARFYGAIEALSERSGVILEAFYQDLNQARMQTLRRRLPVDEWQQAFEMGRQWNKDQAFLQAKKELNLTNHRHR